LEAFVGPNVIAVAPADLRQFERGEEIPARCGSINDGGESNTKTSTTMLKTTLTLLVVALLTQTSFGGPIREIKTRPINKPPIGPTKMNHFDPTKRTPPIPSRPFSGFLPVQVPLRPVVGGHWVKVNDTIFVNGTNVIVVGSHMVLRLDKSNGW